MRSTRALWDPSYKDESWIGEPVRLLPRLKEWVRQNYPGLTISIGEYNFGGEQHISGAPALAEALGRFGSEGIDESGKRMVLMALNLDPHDTGASEHRLE